MWSRPSRIPRVSGALSESGTSSAVLAWESPGDDDANDSDDRQHADISTPLGHFWHVLEVHPVNAGDPAIGLIDIKTMLV